MINIILDGNLDDEFCGKKYPVIEVNNFASDNWSEYQKKAKEIVAENLENFAIIIKINDEKCSLNKLAIALFAAAFEDSGKIEYAVFKVKNLQEAQEKYKPYIALTIGIKYALVLSKETPKTIYKSISELGYLGIKSKRDYINDTLLLSLPNADVPVELREPKGLQKTIEAVALFKALSLAKKAVNLEMKVQCDETPVEFNREEMVQKIVEETMPYLE